MAEISIDLWLWPLSVTQDRQNDLSALLSPDEIDRANRFVKQRHSIAYRIGRGRMREILSEYVGLPAADLRFSYNPQGKPSLPGGPQFNLSHSGGWAALAVTEMARIGVDIERFREVEDGVAKRFFSDAENGYLSELNGKDWRDGFFRCWTRKEAVIKACGPGLSMPLDSFDVTLVPEQPPKVTRMDEGDTDAEDWTLLHLELTPEMVGAIAVESQGRPVQISLREGALPLPA